MMRVTGQILLSTCLCACMLVQKSVAQSVINPADPVLEYNPSAPPTPPSFFNPLVKWVRTLNVAGGAVQARNPGWNSNVYKAYNYNGLSFRVQFPKTYNPTANDGKKYPIIVFLHGQGENATAYLGPPPPGGGSYNYDNHFQLLQGPPQFDAAMQNGQYDGYVLAIQLQNHIASPPTVFYQGILNDIMNIVKYMITNNKVDPFHIVVNGLSEGGVGCWEMLHLFPTYISSAIPMSSPVDFVNWANTGNYFSNKRFTPIWVSQGGVDTHPTPAETQRVADTMAKYGGNFRQSFYPSLAHTTWYNIWAEQDFWPFVNRSYSSNPWLTGGPKNFFPGQQINETIGITAGFSAYEWRRNGSLIAGATSNTLNVTSAGVYDARVLRDGIWSDWSHVPVNIRPGFYEAENWVTMNGIANENTSDVGGGQNVGYIETGDWMDYNVNVVAAGTYTMNFRVASLSAGQLQVKNSAGAVLATVTIPNTGGLQSWQTVSANVSLPAGAQTIRIYAASNGWNINWFEIGTTGTTPPPTTPPVTTRVEAENYILMNGVANENTTDVGGGLNVGYIDAGDWMDYSVNVSSAGTYGLSLRVASTSGSQFQVRNSGGTVLATVVVPNTGGWQNWQTVTANVTLAAGVQTIRVHSVTSGWNINWFEIGAPGTTPPPTTPPVTTRVEAENYILMNGVANENTTDVGGGLNVGYIDAGDWMDYSVNVSSAGTYGLSLRVASTVGSQFQVRNSGGTVLANVVVPNTGGWQNWQTVTANVTLAAGVQTIRVHSVTGGWNINWFEIGAPGTTPPPTTPPVTTRVEAENYILMNGVANENTSDVGGGLNVGYIDAGDWMDYSVNVSSAGTYGLSLRVASTVGSQFQVRNSGGTVLANVVVPNTGGWQNWQTVTANVTLAAGVQTIRVHSVTSGWNFNWFEIGTPTQPTPPPITTRVQAENYILMNGVANENTTDVGGGLNVGYIDANDWMDYSVNVSSAGTYGLSLRVASPVGSQLEVRSSNGTVLATVSVPNTGGWQNWRTVTANVTLAAGVQTIRVHSVTSGWNFNWFEIGTPGTVSAGTVSKEEVVSTTLSSSIAALKIYPNPVINNFQLQINNDLTGQVSIQVYSMSGALQKQVSLNKREIGSVRYSLSIGQLAAGNYIIKVTMNNWTDSKLISKQ